MLQQVDGDLVEMFIDGKFDVIIHGCNCFHNMGAGIADTIRSYFPQALFADIQNSIHGDINKLSNHTAAMVRNKTGQCVTIINLYTQYGPGANLNMPALELGFYKLSNILSNEVRIGIPKIGAGIAGGDWIEIVELLQTYFSNHNLTIVNFNK